MTFPPDSTPTHASLRGSSSRVVLSRHPVDGEVALQIDEEECSLHVRMPFDLTRDEWIELTVGVGTAELLDALTLLVETGCAEADARGGRRVALAAARDGTRISVLGASVSYDFVAGAPADVLRDAVTQVALALAASRRRTRRKPRHVGPRMAQAGPRHTASSDASVVQAETILPTAALSRAR